ncbi:tape measure protein [[Clostridium] symbiosum]|uniref:tape measure protein n=2 Tax=Clostridium symbiosum TaxID=1512 RepID=UPI00189BCE5B|nr:tape measure protein [[Clostridium] symbiosum]
MATLHAMFKLYDQYSATVQKIINGTDRAAKTVLGASKNTDTYNQSLKNTGTAANVASSGLMRLVGMVVSLAAVKKGMDLTDTHTNTNARLTMITDNLEEQKALQEAIFAAADRSRGSYVEMANATAKMKMLAGDAFGSNEEALGFTELLQKSLKVSGAGTSEQQSAFLQLTQAMAAGKLQGDEFRSIMENAPMVANAISQYLGVTKGELKELSSDGAITADIIKNAMFNAADDINGKFAQMPMTFADVWQKIKNAGMEAFGGVFEKANAMLNSDRGQAAIMNLTGLIYMAAGAFSALLDAIGWVGNNLDWLGPIVLGLATAWVAYNTVMAISAGVISAATLAQTVHAASAAMAAGETFLWTVNQYGLNAALMACPITWIIGGIILLITAIYAGVAAFNHFSGTSISATGLIAGAFSALGAFIYNSFIYPVLSVLVMFANFIGNVFNDPLTAVVMLFMDMAVTCVDYVARMVKTIEQLINSIPGVSVDITSGIDNFSAGLKSQIGEMKDEAGWKEFVSAPKTLDVAVAASKGYDAGSRLADNASNLFSGFAPGEIGGGMDLSQFATAGNPATIKGKGKGGAVKVENEEDIEWMRKLAERDYVARIAQNTLAPNIKVEFTGPITKEADVDGVTSYLAEQLKEMIAIAPEGVPT